MKEFLTIQDYFMTFPKPVQFGDVEANFEQESEYIRLDIVSVGSISGYNGLEEEATIYITAFARNQVKATDLIEQVNDFIQNKNINGIEIKSYQHKGQGTYKGGNGQSGLYYIKVGYKALLC